VGFGQRAALRLHFQHLKLKSQARGKVKLVGTVDTSAEDDVSNKIEQAVYNKLTKKFTCEIDFEGSGGEPFKVELARVRNGKGLGHEPARRIRSAVGSLTQSTNLI
jgi:hypothetical protein